MKFYAVRRGRHVGVYTSWAACQVQVKGFPGAQFKAFATKEQAEAYLASPTLPPAPAPSQLVIPDSSPGRHSPVDVWVDGACIEAVEGTLHIGWAYAVYANDQELFRDSGADVPPDAQRHRNVAGEIMAIRKAVEWCQRQGIKEITVHYDYQGLESWVTGEWKSKTSFTQDYAQMVHQSGLNIHWEKVKAHSGELRNELVDTLAREAAQKRKDQTNT